MTSALLMGIDKIPDQTGYFVLNHEGAVLSSAGDLENDEDTAIHITDIVRNATKLLLSQDGEDKFKRISLSYGSFVILITVSNQKIFAVKDQQSPNDVMNN